MPNSGRRDAEVGERRDIEIACNLDVKCRKDEQEEAEAGREERDLLAASASGQPIKATIRAG